MTRYKLVLNIILYFLLMAAGHYFIVGKSIQAALLFSLMASVVFGICMVLWYLYKRKT